VVAMMQQNIADTEDANHSGEVELKVPKLRTLPFETSIIERYNPQYLCNQRRVVCLYM